MAPAASTHRNRQAARATWGLLLHPLADVPVTVHAPCAGTVIESVDSYADAGNRVVLRSNDGGYARLASLRQRGVTVRAGNRVALGAPIAAAEAARPILMRWQDSPDARTPGRPFCLARPAQFGNGGPRCVAAAAPVPGQILDTAGNDADLLVTLILLCPGSARFAVDAHGPAAERFRDDASPVATLTADGFVPDAIALWDDCGRTLTSAADAHA